MSKIKSTQMHEGDTLVLKEEQEVFLQKCCGCGLWHELRFDKSKKDIHITFHSIEGEPSPEEYEHTGTEIIRGEE